MSINIDIYPYFCCKVTMCKKGRQYLKISILNNFINLAKVNSFMISMMVYIEENIKYLM